MTAVQLPLIVDQPTDGWNPYWLSFAASLNRPPGDLAGAYWTARFMAWIVHRWDEWGALVGEMRPSYRLARQDEFTVWLATTYPPKETR